MTTDETGQGMLFAGLPDAPKAPERPDTFRGEVGGLVERAQAAMMARREREAADAEEAARQAELDAAAAALATIEPEAAGVENTPAEAPGPADNVIPLRLVAIEGGKGRGGDDAPRENWHLRAMDEGLHLTATGQSRADYVEAVQARVGPKGMGEFFTVDRRLWHKACELGLNAAIAYLFLARGAGKAQDTRWSQHAVYKKTSIGRARVAAAFDKLQAAGLFTELRGGARPNRHIVTFAEYQARAAITNKGEERRILAIALDMLANAETVIIPKVGRRDNEWGHGNPYAVAERLAKLGLLEHVEGQTFRKPARGAPVDPLPIWLPNSLTDGAAGETPPIELIRQGQNVLTLRIFIDLYFSHSLENERGISWHDPAGLRQSFTRKKLGECGPVIVWGFTAGNLTANAKGPGWELMHGQPGTAEERSAQFWAVIAQLERLGLLRAFPHLIDSADLETAEIIHPLTLRYDRKAEPEELALSQAAYEAAVSLISEERADQAYADRVSLVAPVFDSYPQVSAVGVYRLTYKPGTTASAIWKRSIDDCLLWAEAHRAIAQKDFSEARRLFGQAANSSPAT